MQFKLVTAGIFKKYIYEENIHKIKKEKILIHKFKEKKTINTNKINLILSDTYKINFKQLPKNIRNFTTIEVDRSAKDSNRVESEEFVKKVVSIIRKLPLSISEINIFSTTNALHTYKISKEVFMTGGRDVIRHIYVFQQSDVGKKIFEEKGLKIY